MSDNSFFAKRVGVLGTMHHKEKVIAPILEQELGIKVIVPLDFNTDVFGTFTRELKRPGTQLEAARLKAQKALELTHETLAFASEGTFAPHPIFPGLPFNQEIVILLDKQNNLEVVGQELSTETNYRHQIIKTIESAHSFAQETGFPEHGLVVINQHLNPAKCEIFKGIVDKKELVDIVEYALIHSSNGEVHIETDMRALYNPTRMKNIAKATWDLIKKLQQLCPQCSCPGFDVIERRKGLPCQLCNLPTKLTLSVIYKCQKCDFIQEVVFPEGIETADPSQCLYCNP